MAERDADPASMSFVSVDNVSMIFAIKSRTSVMALADASMEIERNQFVCILGPSGGGKSTLLNIVAGFLSPTRGVVRVAGQPIEGPDPSRIMVFQEFALFPWFTVHQNVAFGLEMKGWNTATRNEAADQYIELVNLRRFRDSYPSELSGGMKQRVAIARALAVNPEILLMDEPFGSLDAQTRSTMQVELLKIWEKDRKTVLFVTHSVEEALVLADRIVLISGRPGRVHEVVENDLPRPRDDTDPRFIALKVHLKNVMLAESTVEA
jgi:NitT/TauT family transport system ATP-binding protein